MEAFLVDTVGLKADPAAAVLKHMADQYDIEVLEDLVHLSEKDMENVIEACGLKRVSAGKLMMGWKAAYGLKEAATPPEPSPDTALTATPTTTPPPPTAAAKIEEEEEGFLPGYSDSGSSEKRSLRLMYFDDEHDDAEGHRSLIVDAEKTGDLFENMQGNAVLFTVFGKKRPCHPCAANDDDGDGNDDDQRRLCLLSVHLSKNKQTIDVCMNE